MWRIQIKFDDAEHDAIAKLAHLERRDKRRQIEAIIRRELIELGLLAKPTPPAPALEVKP
jgi:hypothetical protein